jgi:hypothetical protein
LSPTCSSRWRRSVYPEAEYPAGQWDYQFFYEENFDKACKGFEANIRNVVKALFRKGDPNAVGKPGRTAAVRKAGGWFGGGPCPDIPRDQDVITEADLEAYTAALTRNGSFGPHSWYMNHKASGAYARTSKNDGKLSMPVLFLHAAYDTTCETMTSQLPEPMRRDCLRQSRHRFAQILDLCWAHRSGRVHQQQAPWHLWSRMNCAVSGCPLDLNAPRVSPARSARRIAGWCGRWKSFPYWLR